ncbi:hypothetical protein DL98DRAFT_318192 [Cadophora sp. DSE1049]|nr:hypothetical protein DL98DRAFT_318192 [Cadophora sp. DSE1049]
MNIIAEPNLYRHIQDSKGLQITPLEFRGFLGVCNRNEELFLYDFFPGYGTVSRIEAGWPPAPHYTFPTPIFPADPKLKSEFLGMVLTFAGFMKNRGWQRKIYTYLRETRDITIDFLFLYVDHYHKKAGNIGLKPYIFEDAVLQHIQDEDVHSKILLGPKGVVRFKYDIGDIRMKNAAKHTDEDNNKRHSQRVLRRDLRRAAVALRK